jgi:Tol biopolymer transport system component
MKYLVEIIFITIFIFLSIIKAQDKFECTRLTFNFEQHGFPSWSPDSKFIVYQITSRYDSLGKNGLWVIPSNGGTAKQIYKGMAEHPKWSPDGKYIVFDADTGRNIKMILAEGSEAINFLPDTIHIGNGGLPCWSPDGSKIAFIERKGLSLCIYDMKTRNVKSIFSKDDLIPLPGGWTIDGRYILVALSDRQTRKSTMWKISVDGKLQQRIPGHNENFWRHIALSPDGSIIVYSALVGNYLGLFAMLSDGGKSLPVTITADAHNEGAVWSPDGKNIAFNSSRFRQGGIWIMKVDIDELKKELYELNKVE